MHWPQYTILGLVFLGLGVAIGKHGESSGTYSAPTSLVAKGLLLWLLYEGGFFPAF